MPEGTARPEAARPEAAQPEAAHPEVPDRAALRSGPGRVLVMLYAVFALAASARSAVQIATRFEQAPLAYLLSAFAAVVYVVAAATFAQGGRVARAVAFGACTVELVGVLAVGTASLAFPDAFPDATVWSAYGAGYGFVPLVLPPLGLAWLFRHRHRRRHWRRHRTDGAGA